MRKDIKKTSTVVAKEKVTNPIFAAYDEKAKQYEKLETIAKGYKAEQDRIAEEKRIAEEQRIAEEKRIEEERIAEEQRQAEIAYQAQVQAEAQTQYQNNYPSGDGVTPNGHAYSNAKEYIAGVESGHDYNARNGKYIGKYQLDASYLGGDYSPENQERVAEQYVQERYGSWENAMAHHQSNNWY